MGDEMTGGPRYGPSEAAVDAASRALHAQTDGPGRVALAAAHAPALGLDRSVCLGAVVQWLTEQADEDEDGFGLILHTIAARLQEEFGDAR